ncbi:hypothetical protein B0H14DRAFT_3177562 [Mycena olivaceomarginata]|nr:hypothetical protein B0H14DRAFT_3177562 [Mycena olivaceomarginata]
MTPIRSSDLADVSLPQIRSHTSTLIKMAASRKSIIWVDSEGEDEDFIEIVESKQLSREPVHAPSVSFSGLRYRDFRYSPIKKQRSGLDCEEKTPDDHTLALALQKQWEEDGVARKRAAEDEERSQQLIARLQAMDEKMDQETTYCPQKRRKGGQNNAVPEDGIVFKVVVDADGNTLEGDPDPDNSGTGSNVFSKSRDPDMLGVGTQRPRVKTVTWFVNVKLEVRFEAAKELLASLGIDNSETSLFHSTAANNIQPILEVGSDSPASPRAAKWRTVKLKVMVYISRRPPPLLLVITGRISNEISHAKPRPLGQNGHESWYGTGASVGHFYVVKHVELVSPAICGGVRHASSTAF